MRLSLRLFRLLIWSLLLYLTACEADYSVLPDKTPPGQQEVKKEPEKAAQQYRIKRIVYEGSWAIGATAEFEYGSNGKVSQARYVGHDFGRGAPKGLFTYNASNQLTAYNYQYPYADNQGQTGERTVFSYSPQNSDPGQPMSTILFAQTDFIKADGTYKLLKHSTSQLLNDLVATVRYEAASPGAAATTDRYAFSAGNLVNVKTIVGPDRSETYTFDDKLNPFAGLFGPDVTPVRRYSRNNVTGVTISHAGGQVQTYAINYSYNEQGLPIVAQPSGTSARIRFEYEAY